MNNHYKLIMPAIRFFPAIGSLFTGLLLLITTMNYRGPENNFMAENWGGWLVFLVTLLFGIGWWIGHFLEHSFLTKKFRITVISLAVFFLLSCLLSILALSVLQGFVKSGFFSSFCIFISGFTLRATMIKTEPGEAGTKQTI